MGSSDVRLVHDTMSCIKPGSWVSGGSSGPESGTQGRGPGVPGEGPVTGGFWGKRFPGFQHFT